MYYYLVSLFVQKVIRKNIIGVKTVVNTRLTTLADLSGYDVVYLGNVVVSDWPLGVSITVVAGRIWQQELVDGRLMKVVA